MKPILLVRDAGMWLAKEHQLHGYCSTSRSDFSADHSDANAIALMHRLPDRILARATRI
jgi:hypothetical protein